MTSIKVFRNLKVVKKPILDKYGDPVDYQTQWKPGEIINKLDMEVISKIEDCIFIELPKRKPTLNYVLVWDEFCL